MREVGPKNNQRERVILQEQDWPEVLKIVIQEINDEQDGFNFQVSYDKEGKFYVLESVNDFYVHLEIHNSLVKIRNIFAIEKGNGYGKMIMNKLIEVIKKHKNLKVSKIIADNVSQTEVAKKFWKNLGFKWSKDNLLNMELEII